MSSNSPSRSTALFCATFLLASTSGCGGDEEQPTGDARSGTGGQTAASRGAPLSEAALADVFLRERAVARASVEDWEGAFEELLPLIQREEPAAEDLARVGQVLTELFRFDEAREQFDRARALAPGDPRITWGLFGLAYEQALYEEALPHVQRVLELAPDDYPSQLALANTLTGLERHDDARPLYAALLQRGLDEGGSWYVSAVHRYHWNLVYSGRDDEDGRWLDEFTRLKEVGITAPTNAQQRRGSFGQLRLPAAGELRVAEELRLALLGDGGEPTRFVPAAPVAAAGTAGLFVVRLRDPGLGTGDLATAHPLEPAPLEVVLFGTGGLRVARRESPTDWSIETIYAGAVSVAAPLDVDALDARGGPVRDAQLDLVAATADGLLLLRRRPDAQGALKWQAEESLLVGPDFPVTDLAPVDFDHEGDVDLLVVGPRGARLLRNDGVPAAGAGFTDVTAAAGLPVTGAYAWCTVEDLDVDKDVDLLFGGAAGAFYAKNERGGRFADASSSLPQDLNAEPALFDVDRDGRPDLVARGDGAVRVLANRFEDRWEELAAQAWVGAPSVAGAALVTDLGDVERVRALWPGPAALTPFALRDGAWGSALAETDLEPSLLALGDVSGDGVDDLLVSDGAAFTALIAAGDDRVVRVELTGTKDNRRGVGAIVELRAGPLYQRWFWDGRPRSFSVGSAASLDVLRVNWPNGVVQTLTDIAAPGTYVIKQREGLVGSCPFLYAWNGSTYVFVSDVLGITPLGLPMDAERVVPPDHDEVVLVRGDQLAPKDGFFELQFTEELREVTYLDRIRLDVVDHPSNVEIHPNERFTFPPFPEEHTHTVRGALAPLAAVDQAGRDWTSELAAADERMARTFEPLHGQFLGLADPHFVELRFDAESVRDAAQLRLLMTGWLYWTDASVNMASAGHPLIEFVPPLLWVPDNEGGWVQVGPPLGFPAGKLKTMVVDVTPFLRREDPRLRVSTTLALYWDAIRLAVDADDAALEVTALAPVAAELWERGFSEPLPRHGDAALDWFLWERLADEPRWDQHPGFYTRFGETLPLVTEVDDRFVIMGSGDALTVRFPADDLPPLKAGWSRDYLVHLDGWAKDRDPNTKAALYVEPLPFHGMSGYPYGPDESFPDTPAHRAWRREWNTRPAKRWVEPLAPARD